MLPGSTTDNVAAVGGISECQRRL